MVERLSCAIFLLLIFLIASTIARAPRERPGRIHSPVTIRGFIGGESHKSYVIRAKKGQTLTVRISWRHEDNNHAEFSISRGPTFENSEPIKFGRQSNEGRSWMGKMPISADYFISVVADPSAHYTIRAVLR
jgi:hypothetical protein